LAWQRPQARRLMTHPGVGPITALATETFLGEPNRFVDGKADANSCELRSGLFGNSELTLGRFLAKSWIDVEKSSSHQLSQSEIGSDNPCCRHLSESYQPEHATSRNRPNSNCK
jgi:hypothetical protein